MIDIVPALIPEGRINRPGYSNPCNYITIHNTDNPNRGADARAHIGYVSNTSEKVSWHYTVDDEEIYQHLPDNESGYHAGDGAGKGNRQSIGIEICMNSNGDLLKATDNAAELTAYLMKKHGIPLENVKQHNFWSGKNCPSEIRAGRPYSWQVFLRKVESFMSENKIETAEQALDKLNSAGIVTDKAYWAGALAYVKNLDYLLIKMANSV